MKEKHLLLFFGIATFLTILLFAYLVLMRISTSTPEEIPTPTASVQKPSSPRLPTIPFTKPVSPSLTVDGVKVDNFYKQGTVIDTNGDVSVQKTKDFEIVYLAPFEEFIIDILASPFEVIRPQAEQAFLKQLNITQTEACKLTVSVSTTTTANPNDSGRRHPLSFCES